LASITSRIASASLLERLRRDPVEEPDQVAAEEHSEERERNLLGTAGSEKPRGLQERRGGGEHTVGRGDECEKRHRHRNATRAF
jgi:hypothetical protein